VNFKAGKGINPKPAKGYRKNGIRESVMIVQQQKSLEGEQTDLTGILTASERSYKNV
jgi:hypothetical protein